MSTDRVILWVGTAAVRTVFAWSITARIFDPRCQSSGQITRNQIHEFGPRIQRFREREGHLPARLDELFAPGSTALDADSSPPCDDWGGTYLYAVLSPDRFDLRSFGADGAPGGDDGDADIVWTPAPAPPSDR